MSGAASQRRRAVEELVDEPGAGGLIEGAGREGEIDHGHGGTVDLRADLGLTCGPARRSASGTGDSRMLRSASTEGARSHRRSHHDQVPVPTWDAACARHPFRVLGGLARSSPSPPPWRTVRSAARPATSSRSRARSRRRRSTCWRSGSPRRTAPVAASSSTPRTVPRPTRACQAAIEATLAELAEAPHVIDVSNPFDPRGPTVSPDGTIGFADVSYDTDDIELRRLRGRRSRRGRLARDAGVDVEYSGALGVGWRRAGGRQRDGRHRHRHHRAARRLRFGDRHGHPGRHRHLRRAHRHVAPRHPRRA